MRKVQSYEDLQKQVAEIRSLRLGFVTNFFPDPSKNEVWIKNGDCYTDRVNNTLFIVRQSTSFWNVFYCSTTIEALGDDVEIFLSQTPEVSIMYDIVGRDLNCQPLVELFRSKGCIDANSLVRMTRMTESMNYLPDSMVRYANEKDQKLITEQLHRYFDEKTEQIPYDEELTDYIVNNRVLVCDDAGVLAGFLIFEMNASTLYLRYWFTHPDYRNKKVGSRLLRRFFDEGKYTKRQLLWVVRTNENAIVRYHHYGFIEENMYDYVMQYNKYLK